MLCFALKKMGFKCKEQISFVCLLCIVFESSFLWFFFVEHSRLHRFILRLRRIPKLRDHVPRLHYAPLHPQQSPTATAQASHRQRHRHHCLPRTWCPPLHPQGYTLAIPARLHCGASDQPLHREYTLSGGGESFERCAGVWAAD